MKPGARRFWLTLFLLVSLASLGIVGGGILSFIQRDVEARARLAK